MTSDNSCYVVTRALLGVANIKDGLGHLRKHNKPYQLVQMP